MNTTSAAIIGLSVLASAIVLVVNEPNKVNSDQLDTPASKATNKVAVDFEPPNVRCLNLADDPYAPEQGTGIEDNDLDVIEAAVACQLAVESDPYDIGSRFRLGRVFFAQQRTQQAMDVLEPAVNAGHLGAMTLMTRAVLETGTTDTSVLAAYEPYITHAHNQGYPGADPVVRKLAKKIADILCSRTKRL